MDPIETPVLFLVFNRPDVTHLGFESIRRARPKKLYVAADGPRENITGEFEKVSKVRQIATNVDWDCEVKTLFRESNLGLKNAVSKAINWFFDHEDEGIILEDDCVPDNSFFLFCQELLLKYRDDTRIMAISGDNYQNGISRTNYSYYFSRYPHCWGWATWKRAWQLWDGDLLSWPEIREKCLLENIAGRELGFTAYWENIFNKCCRGEIDSWAYPWVFSCFVQNGLTVLPDVNLVSNIGFGCEATHTKTKNSMVAELSTQEVGFPLKHPPYLVRDVKADNFTDENVFCLTPQNVNKLSLLLSKIKAAIS